MENKTQNNIPTSPAGKEYYASSNGTGAISSIVFIVIAIMLMAVANHFIN